MTELTAFGAFEWHLINDFVPFIDPIYLTISFYQINIGICGTFFFFNNPIGYGNNKLSSQF